jgi:hypothetical protein
MQAYQETDFLESPALQQLAHFVREHQRAQARQHPGLEAFERELHAQVLAVERELLAEELARYDVVAPQVTVNGVTYGQPMEATATYLTAAGEVTVNRHLYRPAGRGTRHICPLELQAGILEGFFTPAAARQGAYVVAQLPPASGAALFAEVGNMFPSASSLARLAQGVATHWEAHREDWEAQLRTQEAVPAAATTLVVSLDGVMAPLRGEATEKAAPTAAPEKQPTGPKGYQEVGCGTVSLHDAEGERVQTVRYGRMPESKKATLCQELEAEVQAILAVRSGLRVVKLADGAKDNWRFLGQLHLGVPSAAGDSWEIVDFYHACDHLHHAVNVVWGEHTPQSKVEFARLKTILKETDGGVECVIEHLRYRVRRTKGTRRTALQKELNYFRHQRHRMDYATYLREHLPIASGVVEAACKTLVTQRLKQSGMRWTRNGGQAILTLRSLIQSARWARGWALLRADYQQPVSVSAVSAYFRLPLAA